MNERAYNTAVEYIRRLFLLFSSPFCSFPLVSYTKGQEQAARLKKIECDKQFRASGVVSEVMCTKYTHAADTHFSEAPHRREKNGVYHILWFHTLKID